ncbi:lipopolysaccharide biosynthesis protein [Aeromonas veronii]
MFKKAFILYGCQIYKAVLPLAFTPLILNTLGAERYGMIAFFYMLVGLLGLLDAGISGSFLKLVATNRDVTINYRKVTVLFVKVLLLFIFISGGVILFFIISDNFIATSWLKTSIEKHEAIYSIKAIGFILAALYIKSYLSSFLNGMEKQEWVNIWSVFYSSLFYFGTFYAIREIESTLYVFFNVMLTLAMLDVLAIFGLAIYAYISHINKLKIESNRRYELDEKNGNELKFKNVLRFSLQLSGLSLIWVVATQIDKFVLSAYISLEEYAKYQIAVQVCAVIAIFSSPLTQLLLPRLSALYADNKLNEYAKLYCSVMLIFIIFFAPIMPYFFIFGDDLIALWMGDCILAKSINAYAKWLVSAAYIAATMNFIFILLYTLGQLKKHFYAYAIYSCFTIPLSIFFAKNYGAVGSAKFVFWHTFIFMLLWGGMQIKSKLPCFIVLCSIVYISTILLSTLFFEFSFRIADGYDLHWSLELFIPPIINLLLYTFLLYIFKKRVNFFLSNLRLALN